MPNPISSKPEWSAVLRMGTVIILLAPLIVMSEPRSEDERRTVEFCLAGELDLGVRLQGRKHQSWTDMK